jgi:glycosyltransferase involved in cell wall biosynthesis
MSSLPGVSVVIPTYNRADLLPEALDSVLAQDWPDLEVVVVDDGSTDATPQLLDGYVANHGAKMRVIRQPNGGESQARSHGIRAASRPYVALLDSDNFWLPGKLRRQMQLFLDDRDLDFTFTGYYNFGDVPREPVVLPHWETTNSYALEQLLVGCCINTSTVIAKRSVLIDVGLFDTSLRCCQDHDLWLRIAIAGYRIAYLPEPLIDYRVHEAGISTNLMLVSESAERVYHKLFDGNMFPAEFQARRKFYLSRCYLNTACRALQAGVGAATRAALRRAARTRPLSIRPGWGLMYLQSFFADPPHQKQTLHAQPLSECHS